MTTILIYLLLQWSIGTGDASSDSKTVDDGPIYTTTDDTGTGEWNDGD